MAVQGGTGTAFRYPELSGFFLENPFNFSVLEKCLDGLMGAHCPHTPTKMRAVNQNGKLYGGINFLIYEKHSRQKHLQNF